MSNVKILVLDRGWVVAGDCWESEKEILLKDGATIRRWGTTEGLGELAKLGKREDTVLNPFNNDVLVSKQFIIMKIDCNQEAWKC